MGAKSPQNQRRAALASRGYLLETGRVVAEGDTASLRANDNARKAYLRV